MTLHHPLGQYRPTLMVQVYGTVLCLHGLTHLPQLKMNQIASDMIQAQEKQDPPRVAVGKHCFIYCKNVYLLFNDY